MLSSTFEIIKPNTLPEALDILHDGKENIRILAGGTDVIPRLKEGIIHPEVLMDLSLLKSELNQIAMKNGILRIGSFATHTQICQSNLINNTVPVLAQACQTIGCRQIRNRGTIGGNIVNASPAGDTLPVLFALNAGVKIMSKTKIKELSMEDLMVGPGKTSLSSDEIISEVCIPIEAQIIKGIFKKLGTRNALNIAIASAAIVLDSKGNKKITYGALGPRPIRAYELEETLNHNKNLLWEDVKTIIFRTVHPISDVRASADYRKEMAANLTYMCLAELGVLLSVNQ